MATVKSISNATGLSWWSIVMVLLMFAFFLYIVGRGSLPTYKNLLF